MNIKCHAQVISKKTIDEMPDAWTREDYLFILDQLGFAGELEESGIEQMCMLALSNQEPEASAELLLSYKLKEHLTKIQIQQLSREMQEEKSFEVHPTIFIQRELFNINQLLFNSFDGHFPNCKALEVVIALEVNPIFYMRDEDWINEIIIKALAPALGEHSSIVRRYKKEMNGYKRFSEASGILWKTEISKSMDGCFDIRLYSSEYWLNNLQASAAFDTSIEVLGLQERAFHKNNF